MTLVFFAAHMFLLSCITRGAENNQVDYKAALTRAQLTRCTGQASNKSFITVVGMPMTQNYSFKTRPARGNLRSFRGGTSAELLDQGEKIRDTPVLGDLTVVHSHRVHGFKMDFSTRRRHT
jgi:hypothetical protein